MWLCLCSRIVLNQTTEKWLSAVNRFVIGYTPRHVAERDSVKFHLTCCELQVLRILNVLHLEQGGGKGSLTSFYKP